MSDEQDAGAADVPSPPDGDTPRTRNELRLQMQGFEGPLDLLLHLIRKHELDIFDIPIAFVTEEYLAYIDAMESLDLGIAGEYLVMAATLLQIKSRMLLPKPEVEEDELDGFEEDPRELLVRRLLEYQRYKDVAESLGGRELMGRDVFRRPSRADRYRDEAGPGDLMPLDLFHLLDAFRRAVADRPAEALHEVTPESMSLKQAVSTVAEHLQARPRCTLTELLLLFSPHPTRIDIVITFLALLEMAKLRMIRLFQARLTESELIVERAVVEYDEVAQQLDGIEEPG